MAEIIIKNTKIIEFYNKYKQLNIETVNIALIDTLENVILNLEGNITKTVVSDMFDCLKTQSKEISNIKKEFNDIISSNSELIKTYQSQITSELTSVKDIVQHELNNIIYSNTEITKSHQNLITCELVSVKDIVKHEFNNIVSSNTELTRSNQSIITSEILSIKDIINRLNNDISTGIISKFYEFSNNIMSKFCDIRNNYIEDMRLVVEKSSGDTTIKILEKLEKENDKIIDKTNSILHDLLPKNILQNFSQYESNIRNFKDDITKHIEEIKHSNISTDKLQMILIEKYNNLTTTLERNIISSITSNEDNIKSTIKEINNKTNTQQENINNELVKLITDKLQIIFIEKYNNLNTTLERNITNYISTSEDKIKSTINDIKEINNKTNLQQENINCELVKFLNQYAVPCKKGIIGENILHKILHKVFPTDEIINTTHEANSGDFILKRNDKPIIILENKNYSNQHVSKAEVEKFISSVRQKKCCGIMISQMTGIISKKNFDIDINNGTDVLVYVHNMNYSEDTLLLACDVIDTIHSKLIEMHKSDNSITLSEDTLFKINEEYQNFISKRTEIINDLNDNIKNIINKIKKLELSNSLSNILCSNIPSTKLTTYNFKCDGCAETFTSMKGLGNHKRVCTYKPENNDVIENSDKNNSESTTDINSEPVIIIVDKPAAKKTTKKTKTTKS